ncbi:MAG: hypothetical protein VYD06_02080, partial [SAR324 cluster bacterium]|nr:hypothetical protein [SAR324 cluster bacterium]
DIDAHDFTTLPSTDSAVETETLDLCQDEKSEQIDQPNSANKSIETVDFDNQAANGELLPEIASAESENP